MKNSAGQNQNKASVETFRYGIWNFRQSITVNAQLWFFLAVGFYEIYFSITIKFLLNHKQNEQSEY